MLNRFAKYTKIKQKILLREWLESSFTVVGAGALPLLRRRGRPPPMWRYELGQRVFTFLNK